ncbi:hypothetical protein CPB86DRAFT_700492, partial [Serendipita vermifera]
RRTNRSSRRHPSAKLLARTSSLSSATGRSLKPTTVTVLCRSSSVGPPRRNRKRELPFLSPSGETTVWPWVVEGEASPPLPRINVYRSASNSFLARTSSISSGKGRPSFSRPGSRYTSLSRNGSVYTSLSRAGTGLTGPSGMASSIKPGYDESIWGDQSYEGNTTGYRRHFLQRGGPPQYQGDDGGAIDDESDNEPRLANIVAPHVSSIAGSQGRPSPVERQRSIQSLRACLQRHHSLSRGGSPCVATFPKGISGDVAQHTPMTPSFAVHPDVDLPQKSSSSTSIKRNASYSDVPRFKRGRRERREFDDEHLEGCRRVEGADGNNAREGERGRRSSSGLLGLNVGGFRWSSSASHTPRNSSTSRARDHGKYQSKGKLTDKDLERERLLWGTSWGQRERDREAGITQNA